jgi:formiminoglutamase
MTTRAIEFLGPPQMIRLFPFESAGECRVSNWITPWDFEETVDVAVVGVPVAKASLWPVGVDTTPNAIRKALVHVTTYNPDLGVDLRELRVRHVGDIRTHATDLRETHRRVESALREVFARIGGGVTVLLGGDGSLTAPGVSAFSGAGGPLGLIQFDARADARDVREAGLSDLSAMRAVLEAGIGVAASSVVVIGLHGFVSAHEEHRWAAERGVRLVSVREVRRMGIESVTRQALETAAPSTARVYVSFDATALEIPASGPTWAAAPGGLMLADAQEALFLLGRDPRVRVLDLVGFDTHDDAREMVARTAAGLLLCFLAGIALRQQASD